MLNNFLLQQEYWGKMSANKRSASPVDAPQNSRKPHSTSWIPPMVDSSSVDRKLVEIMKLQQQNIEVKNEIDNSLEVYFLLPFI